MFVDSSAIVAILIDAPEAGALIERLDASATPRMTTPTAVFEATTVLGKRLELEPPTADRLVKEFLDVLEIRVTPVTEEMAASALEAFALYGKGRHPAALNFGDCFSYAGSRAANVPLLYAGDGFSQTDLRQY
ncbi:type II toxin-antitoxin system VapC family toxin [Ciceribacter ferrooxidans]|uniref:Ribonuclease VapC n=1 Tax=Ciceribacter ferrooxidans TaxID=2509717 RepID=A0A4Q2TH91_9HYPH|nr:type II toxin-antitoxin system VapC family toxin [Ciceribacter ferrooxidans]RYC17758.1 type II toxin-antitoxin system VapC family toxin [Ciceribacter ferrooxidans]